MHSEALTQTLDATAQRELLRALDGLRYGTVEITVHNAPIVQIGRRDQARFDDATAHQGSHQSSFSRPDREDEKSLITDLQL